MYGAASNDVDMVGWVVVLIPHALPTGELSSQGALLRKQGTHWSDRPVCDGRLIASLPTDSRRRCVDDLIDSIQMFEYFKWINCIANSIHITRPMILYYIHIRASVRDAMPHSVTLIFIFKIESLATIKGNYEIYLVKIWVHCIYSHGILYTSFGTRLRWEYENVLLY